MDGSERVANDRRTGRRTKLTAAGVLILLGLGFLIVELSKMHDASALASSAKSDDAAPLSVDLVTVKPATANIDLSLPGETAAWYQATIYARVDGYVGKWFVDIGDHVTAGQLLATIETPELDAELETAKARLKAAEAEVQVRVADADFAESTYLRWKESPKGVVSQQETEDKKARYESTKASLAASHAQVSLAEGEVGRLQALEEFKRVTAPFAGTIIQRRIDIGNLVTAGSSATTTPLYRVDQDDPIRTFVDVPQNAAASVGVGTVATITTGGAKPLRISGKVTRTSDAVNPDSRTLRVEIDLPNPDGTLVPGSFVEANFNLQNQGVGEVPAAALMFRPDGLKVASVVHDQVLFRPVSIAQDNGKDVVLASGVSPGDSVVLNINSAIGDGDKVHVDQIDGKAATTVQTAER